MTQAEFRAYILRRLGSPIHNVEITNDQLDDCIAEAVDRFTERHYDAIILALYKLDLTAATSSYTLPTSIKTVLHVFPGNNLFSAMSETENLLIPISPMPYADYLMKLSDITSIYTFRMAIKTWEEAISNQNIMFDFNYSMHKITILGSIDKILESYPNTDGFYLLVYECADDSVEDIYNNRWLKAYSVALSKRQWATNIRKYNNIPLPGGGDLNHADLMADANDEIQRLEDQLEDEFVLPPSMQIG
jgi:hypothetical protein